MLSLFPQLFFLEQFAPFILRLVLGAIFIARGSSKIFMKDDKLKMAAGGIELLGAVLVLAGFLTQLGAILLIADRAVAIWKTKFSELNIILIAIAVCLIVLGPGFLSIDYPF
jgi:uncharacterized membrane protein YphA (DoxX/SURF4 family)